MSSPQRLLPFLTSAAAFAVANLYYAQPLAQDIARDLHATAAGVSAALVATQLGYAVGMLLLVPLGDVAERRAVLSVTAGGGALALLAFALAPSVALLTAAGVAVGLGASVTQMILPLAIGLGTPDQRGRIVGNVMSGVLAGILLSRTAGGALGSVIGWRGVFVTAAAVMTVLALLLRGLLPTSRPPQAMPYRALLASLASVVLREPVLRRRALVGALGFASFSMFWSTIVFHLGASAIHGGAGTAGALGILGLTGIVVAPVVGRLAMRVQPSVINVAALAVTALAFVVLGALPDSLIATGVGVVLLDAGTQASHLANQTVIFGLSPDERSRINAIYMVAYFLGGAGGTAIAARAWENGGWTAVCVAGGVTALAAMLPLGGHERRD